jgi:protein-tyrosine phosphatase
MATAETIHRQIQRLLHASRHRAVKRRLRRIGRPRRILVICQANICRSPYLAAALRRLLPTIEITSAGLMDSGRQVPEYGLGVASERGLDLRSHRSQALTEELVRGADLVIAMDVQQASYVANAIRFATSDRVFIAGDLDPEPGESRGIRDPWRQSAEVFRSCYERLDRCALTLLSLYRIE